MPMPLKKREKKTVERSNSQIPLLGENHHNEPKDDWKLHNLNAQNIHNVELQGQQAADVNVVLQRLHVILNVPGQSRSLHSSDCEARERFMVLMKTFWSRTIPQPPESIEQNLQDHLTKVQEEVLHQMDRLGPQLQSHDLMGYLVASCCHQTAHHLQNLLQSVHSSRSCYQLMHWAHHQYLSYQEFSRSDCKMIKEWDKWENQAKIKLFQTVLKEIKIQLENILQSHKSQNTCDTEEAYVGLHVDVIQCVFAMPETVRSIDEELRNQLLQVCSQELLTFVKRYVKWQREFLVEQANLNKPQSILFLKTLKTCKEIRTHIQKENMGEAVVLLDKMETFTKNLLVKVVTEDVEQNLKRYFKLDRSTTLFVALEEYFPHLPFVNDEHKDVLGDIYKVVTHVYFKHLIGTSRRKLRNWSADVGAAVHDDAVQLHNIISSRVKDVYEYSRLLLIIEEVLETPTAPNNLDSMKITMAIMHKECSRESGDLRLLPNLLLWRGLPRRDARMILEALPVHTPMPRSTLCFLLSCCGCCD